MKRHALPFAVLVLVLVGLVSTSRLLAQDGLPRAVDLISNTVGEVNLTTPQMRFIVFGSGGGSVSIRVQGLSDGFAPRFHVINASSVVVLDVANPGGEDTVSGQVYFATSGPYIIEVSGERGSSGQFMLNLRPGIAPPAPRDLLVGQPVSAVVGRQTPVLIYRFNSTGFAGQTLSILGDRPAGGPAYTIVNESTGSVVVDSDGSWSGGTHVLSTTNSAYRIDIRANDAEDDIAFTICLGCTESPNLAASTATPTPTETATPSPTATPEACNVVPSITAGAVNVRSGAGTNFNMVGAIRVGQAFPALAQTEDGFWLMLDLDGVDGWVASSLAHLEGDCAALPVVSADGIITRDSIPAAGRVLGNCTIVSNIAGNANVRSGPGQNYDVLGVIRPGQIFPALAQTDGGNWIMFRMNGMDVWITGSVVRLQGVCATLPVVTPTAPTP